jgi:hypothetical protein
MDSPGGKRFSGPGNGLCSLGKSFPNRETIFARWKNRFLTRKRPFLLGKSCPGWEAVFLIGKTIFRRGKHFSSQETAVPAEETVFPTSKRFSL